MWGRPAHRLPIELSVPICRLYNAVEDGVAHYYSNEFGSAVPRELLRELLSEALDAEDLREALNLRGCRLCSSVLQEGYWLLAHPSGRGHELPTLTVMRTANEILNISVCKACSDMQYLLTQAFEPCLLGNSTKSWTKSLENAYYQRLSSRAASLHPSSLS